MGNALIYVYTIKTRMTLFVFIVLPYKAKTFPTYTYLAAQKSKKWVGFYRKCASGKEHNKTT